MSITSDLHAVCQSVALKPIITFADANQVERRKWRTAMVSFAYLWSIR